MVSLFPSLSFSFYLFVSAHLFIYFYLVSIPFAALIHRPTKTIVACLKILGNRNLNF